MLYLGRFCALFLFLLQVSCGSDSIDNNNTQEQVASCESTSNTINWLALQNLRCEWLSDYGLFNGLPSVSSNSKSGIHYKLGSELFSDHARKYRYIYLPANTKIGYQQDSSLSFPLGTVLVKVFALPDTSTEVASEEIIEIRLMVLRENGWIFIPYVWDVAKQDAYLAISGSDTSVSFKHNGQQLDFTYESPTLLQCGNCHQVVQDKMHAFLPIGPKIRHLNRSINVNNKEVNQLEYWQSLGLIDLPAAAKNLPYAPNWRDNTKPLQDRAKAYLDINCAHCHNPYGAAALSGLRLEYTRANIDRSHGVCNSSHGWRGGGFDIWPGHGKESSIPRRMEMNEATDRMPPIGRAVSDDEAVLLIQEWIDSMPEVQCSS